MDSGYGFLCYANSPDAFWDSIKRARETFHDTTLWTELVERAMSRDFFRAEAALRYETIYAELAGASSAAA